MPTVDRAGDEGLLEEVKDDRQRLNRFKRWFDQSLRATQEWTAEAIESRQFVNGQQWREGDKERLTRSKRPFLTINKILPRVNFLLGLQRSQREEPKLLPFEGGDVRTAELMGGLYKWYGTRCREPVVDTKVFDDKIVTGLGYWKVTWQFGDDPEGNLLWERVDPLAVFADPNWLDAGWEHAEYVIQATWFTLPQAIELWPEHEETIRRDYGEWLSETTSHAQQIQGAGEFAGDTFSSDRSYWDPETQRLRVLEVWYRRRATVEAVMRNETQEISTEPKRVAAIKQAVARQRELQGAFTFLKMPVSRIHLAHCISDLILDDDRSPYRPATFPIFPTVGFYWWRVPFGVVGPLKDLQRETNRRRSTMMEMVQRAALSGWYNPQDQGAKKEDLENYGAGISKVIPFKTMQPIEIAPPQLPQALIYLDQNAARDMDAVSNIHAELLGVTTQRTVSGRAIRARQQSGLVVQEPLLESFRQDKEPAVRFAIELIQQFTAPPKALRILGSIAVRAPQGQEAQMLQGMAFVEVRELLQGAMQQEFDVIIGSQPFDPSQQQQRLQALLELAQQFAPYMPPDVFIEQLENAGVLTEDQAAKTLAFVQQKLALEQAQQAAAAAGQAPAPAAPPELGVTGAAA